MSVYIFNLVTQINSPLSGTVQCPFASHQGVFAAAFSCCLLLIGMLGLHIGKITADAGL